MRDILERADALPSRAAQAKSNPRALRDSITRLTSTVSFTLWTAGLCLLPSPLARAFTYADQDVLMVFRSDGYNDVVFNLGNVGQFLNQTNGYRVTVTNWSPEIVTSNFSLTNGSAQSFILAATGNQDPNLRAWVSDGDPLAAALENTPSQWKSGLYSPIAATGLGAQADPNAPSATNYDVVAPNSHYAFDYIASNNGQTPTQIPFLGGSSGLQFPAAGAVPGTVLFYEIHPSTALPKPAATLVGSFTLTESGGLTFQAGALADAVQITSATFNSGIASVTFNSTASVNYRLRYSNQLTADSSTWTIGSSSVVGDGNQQTLQDASASDSVRFYRVESFP